MPPGEHRFEVGIFTSLPDRRHWKTKGSVSIHIRWKGQACQALFFVNETLKFSNVLYAKNLPFLLKKCEDLLQCKSPLQLFSKKKKKNKKKNTATIDL